MSLLHRVTLWLLDGIIIMACFVVVLFLLSVLALTLSRPSHGATCQHEPSGNGSWSWREIDGQKCWYGSRRVLHKVQLHWPHEAKETQPKPTPDKPTPPKPTPPLQSSWLEKAGDKATAATLYFPTLTQSSNSLMDAYPLLVWQQPWLNPQSIMQWPLLLNVDKVPFTAWTKRIGE
jgi:hypothetical protein